MMKPPKITPNQVATFQRDGYVVLGPILTAETLATLRDAYDRIFHATEKPASYRNLGEQTDGSHSKGAVLQIINMCDLDDAFQQMLHRPDLLDIAETLIGSPNISLYHDQALYKPALHGDIVPWHQDNGYWKLTPATAVSFWVALDDADEENGCMWTIPGSHLAGEAGHQSAGQYVAQLKADAEESLAVAVPLPAGSAMAHHCRTLHSTKLNLSPRQRRAWVIHYMQSDTRQNGNILINHLLLRGERPALAER
jgi:ectoine hydroxylase-related dioxygenase (phytanoyl-CoA dioxygenase family)